MICTKVKGKRNIPWPNTRQAPIKFSAFLLLFFEGYSLLALGDAFPTKLHSTGMSDVSLLPVVQNGNVNMAKSDFQKRTELLAEFMYWIFDSYIIPLIRTNFYVTESNHDKNKLYYFRQDSWKRLTEPTILELRTTMFEEMPRDFLRQMITAPAASKNPLRFSQVRLLPKQSGFRPIMNLRKRPEIVRGGRRVLGRSINSQLASVLKVLDYELVSWPECDCEYARLTMQESHTRSSRMLSFFGFRNTHGS